MTESLATLDLAFFILFLFFIALSALNCNVFVRHEAVIVPFFFFTIQILRCSFTTFIFMYE